MYFYVSTSRSHLYQSGFSRGTDLICDQQADAFEEPNWNWCEFQSKDQQAGDPAETEVSVQV